MGLIRATVILDLTRHVLTMRSPRSTPMSITSTLVKKRGVRAKMLLLATILINSASRLVRPKRHSQRRQLISLQYAPSTVAKDSESVDEFILDRETVVRFVQDSIAEAVDRQKRNDDKNGNFLLFNKGELVLLSTVNLPRHIVNNGLVKRYYPSSSVHFVCCAA